MTVVRHATLDALASAAADELKTLVQQGVRHVALSGGSTPKALFKVLVARGRAFLPWDDLHLWWGDERCVPPDHAESNFGMTNRELIQPLGLAATRVHRMRGEDPPETAAKSYEEQIQTSFGKDPRFDLVFLGMGPDGHTASLFPGVAIDPARLVIVTTAPTGMARISMTPKLINAAHHVRFLAAGADKADVLAAVVKRTGDYPAQLIHNADLVWHVDEAAARSL